MRPRLAALATLAEEVIHALRSGVGRVLGQGSKELPAGEERSADEVKRRLDDTRERLKRETPPTSQP
jgi:hypothetical protein